MSCNVQSCNSQNHLAVFGMWLTAGQLCCFSFASPGTRHGALVVSELIRRILRYLQTSWFYHSTPCVWNSSWNLCFFLKLYLFFLKLFFECQCCFFINALLICFDALSCFLCCVFGIQHRHRGWGCSTAGWSEAKFARRAELPQRVLFHGLSGGLLLLDSLGPWPIVSLETLLDALF